MSLQPVSTPDMANGGTYDAGDSTGLKLHGPWLALARLAWIAVVLTVLAIFAISLPAYYDELHSLSNTDIGAPDAIRAGLEQVGISVNAYATYGFTVEIAFVLGFITIATLIASCKFDDTAGLVISLALITFAATFSRAPQALVADHPSMGIIVNLLSLTGFIAFFTCLYVFPDGRFVPGWTRLLVVPWIVVEIDHYFFPTTQAIDAVMLIVFLGLVGTCIYAQIYRYRNVSNHVQRQQTKWVVTGFTAWIAAFLGYGLSREFVQTGAERVLHELIAGTVMVAFLLLIPVSIGLAVLRHQLFDIDVVINRALVYGTLTASVILVYVAIVGYIGGALRTGNNLAISLVATGIVAVIFQPLRERLQRGVNRLVYGERDEPYAVLSRLGQRLETTLTPDAVLPTVVQTVAEALKLPHAAIEIRRGDTFAVAASTGTPVGASLRTPLLYQGDVVGRLTLSPRDARDTFSSSDWRLLEDLARQIGIAVHAVNLADDALRLSADLQHSRAQLVTAREEERRRLRRDLHDGLGPQLASVTMKAEAAGDLVDSDPEHARKLMADVMRHAQTAVADVRRVVYALRPPALDSLGLVGALRGQATQFDHGSLRILVDARDELPPLGAAVEVAAYRIALEALNNVVRHAAARTCVIRVGIEPGEAALRVEIEDDGSGIGIDRKSGVGLNSMRERASELGGDFVVQAPAGGGTRIVARLPLAHKQPEG